MAQILVEIRPTDDRLDALRAMPYADYLQTPEWRRRRDQALARALWCCEWQGCTATRTLEVHHKTYDRIGEELPADVIVLCARHHQGLHAQHGDLQRLQWAIIRDVLKTGGFESLADFVEAVKTDLSRKQIPFDPHVLNDTVLASLRDITLTYVAPQREVKEQAPAITHRRAVQLLAQWNVTGIKTMPKARLITRSQADKIKALQMVLDEIEAAEARCDALENGH